MHKTDIAGDVRRPGRCGLLAVPLTDLVSLARCSARPLSPRYCCRAVPLPSAVVYPRACGLRHSTHVPAIMDVRDAVGDVDEVELDHECGVNDRYTHSSYPVDCSYRRR